MLGLALHELVAKARRYGALSGPRGNVAIGWSLEANGAEARLAIQWRETGGPAVREPEHSGFGRRIVERQLPEELGAETAIAFQSQGIEARAAIPINRNVVAS